MKTFLAPLTRHFTLKVSQNVQEAAKLNSADMLPQAHFHSESGINSIA